MRPLVPFAGSEAGTTRGYRRREDYPLSDLQRRIIAYCLSVSEQGVARVTQDEIVVALNSHRGCVTRSMQSLKSRGLISIDVVRATFVGISDEAAKLSGDVK